MLRKCQFPFGHTRASLSVMGPIRSCRTSSSVKEWPTRSASERPSFSERLVPRAVPPRIWLEPEVELALGARLLCLVMVHRAHFLSTQQGGRGKKKTGSASCRRENCLDFLDAPVWRHQCRMDSRAGGSILSQGRMSLRRLRQTGRLGLLGRPGEKRLNGQHSQLPSARLG